MKTPVARAFHDWRNKGYFVDNDHGLFFVPDEEMDRVGYDPVQAGLPPVDKDQLTELLMVDVDGWLEHNLTMLGYAV